MHIRVGLENNLEGRTAKGRTAKGRTLAWALD